MKITHYRDLESVSIDNDVAKGVTGRVAVGKADGANKFCMRVFELAENGYSPRHTHDWEHEIFIHSGKGEVMTEKGWQAVEAGYVVFVPGNVEHQIRNAGPDPFVFACLIPAGPPEM